MACKQINRANLQLISAQCEGQQLHRCGGVTLTWDQCEPLQFSRSQVRLQRVNRS